MDNQRLFALAGLGLLLFVNYQTWQHDYAPTPVPAATAQVAAATQDANASALRESAPSAGTSTVTAAPAVTTPTPTPSADPSAATTKGTDIHIHTDVLDLTVNTAGVEIRGATLNRYSLSVEQKDAFVDLLRPAGAEGVAVLQWGLAGAGAASAADAVYSTPETTYTLADGAATLDVPFTWTGTDGLTITRTLHFTRGNYAISLEQTVHNAGESAVRARPYAQLVHHWTKVDRSMFNPATYSYQGPAVYNGKKYQKLSVDKPDPEQLPKSAITDGWIAALQHHFVTAIVPDAKVPTEYSMTVANADYRLTAMNAWQDVAAGATATFVNHVYIGPKLQDQLDAIAPKLDLTVDYGTLTVIAKPLFWLLSQVHKLVNNWGLAIILVTIIIKGIFFPLAQTSGRSMARMRNIAPRVKALQDRYKDNREELGKQMMELYKREKVNPLSGCLPMLVQIPVFMGFYWVLLESVEMRQAPFVGWLHDLSVKDPYFVLPALMCAAMFGQFKMNPTPPDPTQAKVFAIMPFFMTAMMAFFPAGLVLYWITNTGLSIAQQWHINKVVAEESQKARA
jgi:YidC/Oxa1 family membrane protein insertase